MVIYAFTFKETGEIVYVGQAVNFNKRMTTHKCNARNGTKWPICAALRKYGWDAFDKVILLESKCRAQLNLFEMALIAKYAPKYNLAKGGAGKKPVGRKPYNKGQHYSEEQLAQVRKSWAERGNKNGNGKPIKHLQTGIIYRCSTDAAEELGLNKSRICDVLKHRRPHTEGNTFSFDLLSPMEPPHKLLIIIRKIKHLETGIIYKDMGEASRALNIPAPNIRKVLIGERPHAGGQHFSFVD